ncbi:hypothetical protein [Sphingobacterium sp.]|uniref:hypothetical protein n=1 Tax=Sphingobacterium sp. TaxID=341027 RepID=UPI0028A21A62|nr:hypothetical protein [Sphingobacterium sp.]
MKKQVLFLILCLFTFKAFSNDIKKKEIDELLNKAKESHASVNLLQQLESAMKARDLANKYDYDEGKTKAQFWIADALLYVGLFKESFKSIENLQGTKYYDEDPQLQSETHGMKGKCYMYLGLTHQAIQEFHLQLAAATNLESEKQKKFSVFAYGNLSTIFGRTGKIDSLVKYNQLQLETLRGLDEKENALLFIGVYDDMGNFYTKKLDFPKAEYYLKKSLELVERYNVPVYYNTMTYLGNLEQEKENYKEGLVFFDKSLANKKAVGNRNAVRNSYRFLADYYAYYKLGDAKAQEYEFAFSRLNDSLEKENRQVMDMVLARILNSKDKESATKVSKSTTISIIVLVMSVISIVFFTWRVRRNRKIIVQKEEALQETETINKGLVEQIGENKFNNLIELAKNNNPEFLTLFKELYPEFIQALKTYDSNLRSTELEFCAMAFLNFSTKNISEYTYVTIRAVQVRKNRLRKKFDIPSDADFNNWMRELGEKSVL